MEAISVFDSERQIFSRRIKIYFFKMFDPRETRTGREFVLEGFNGSGKTLSQGLNPPIIEVLYVAHDLMTCRSTLGKEAKAYTLDVATEYEFTSNLLGHR